MSCVQHSQLKPIGWLLPLWFLHVTVHVSLHLEFKGPTLSYGPRFFHFNLWPSVQHQGHELKWKKQGAVTYSTD